MFQGICRLEYRLKERELTEPMKKLLEIYESENDNECKFVIKVTDSTDDIKADTPLDLLKKLNDYFNQQKYVKISKIAKRGIDYKCENILKIMYYNTVCYNGMEYCNLTQQQMAEELGCSRTYTVKLFKLLREQGYIENIEKGKWSITEQGKEYIDFYKK